MKIYQIACLNLLFMTICSLSSVALQRTVSRTPLHPAQQNVKQKVYVAPFSSRGKLDPGLAVSFASEFERALIHTQCYNVLERNDIDQLVKQARNERSIATINDLGKDITGRLHIQGATGVIFGEVDDDSNSGEVVFITKMEYFDSTIAWEKASSLSKKHIYDPAHRAELVRQLIDNLCPGQQTVTTSYSSAQTDSTPARKPVLSSGLAHGYQVQLNQCQRSGQSVTCYLTVTNQNDFRALALGSRNTEIYDSKSRVFRASQVSLAGIKGPEVTANILQNRPADAAIVFETVPIDVSEIYLMIVGFGEGGYPFQVKFSDKIPIR